MCAAAILRVEGLFQIPMARSDGRISIVVQKLGLGIPGQLWHFAAAFPLQPCHGTLGKDLAQAC